MNTVLNNLPDTFDVPATFQAAHYCLGDMLRLLGLDDETGEYEFWCRYKSGRIPPGVWLPSEQPAICWNRKFIDSWMALGCPAQPGVLAHEQLVYDALVTSISEVNPGAAAAMFGTPEFN